jgi:hypothetical protein
VRQLFRLSRIEQIPNYPAGTVWSGMTDERRVRFKELCEIAEVESDPELLSDLACEICEIILDEANDRTKRKDLIS